MPGEYERSTFLLLSSITETYIKYKITQETLQQIKRKSIKKTANNKTLCSNEPSSPPPLGNNTNTETNSGFVLFFKGYFGGGVSFFGGRVKVVWGSRF